MSLVNIGIVGYGYWGPNLVRNFSGLPNVKVKRVSDLRQERLSQLVSAFPNVQPTTNVDDLFNDPELDAIVIATPVNTHFPLAKRALEAGKHVLLEKPMTSTAAEAEQLVELATKAGLVVMVDHTFLYTGAVQKIKELVDTGQLGKIQYFDSTRINLGLFQHDVNVLWDLAPHDISIITHLTGEVPSIVQARGISHTPNGIENIAYLTLEYDSGLIAHFNCSWISPVKVRMTMIGGDKKMVVYNDTEPTEKVKIYDTGFDIKTDEEINRLQVDYRVGDIYIPKLSNKEALAAMAGDFIKAITEGTEPISNWKTGMQTVRILEASQKSIKNNGREVQLQNLAELV